MNALSSVFRQSAVVWCAALLAGCGGGLPPIPPTGAVTKSAPDAQAVFAACLEAHGGAAAYARLHDVNVRFDSHWASVGPKLQPVLSDTGYRGGSEERYVPATNGFIFGQDHTGTAGTKHVYRTPGEHGSIWVYYNPKDHPYPASYRPASDDLEVKASAGLVTDAYSMFLFGPEFFVRRGAKFQKVDAAADVNGHVCDQLVTVLQPGFGPSAEDKVLLFIDRQDRLLRRVQFTLNALEGTKGAEVHVDLMDHRRLAGVLWPTRFFEHIDRPVNLDAHRWQLLGFDVNRRYDPVVLSGPENSQGAAPPAKPLTAQ